MVFTTPAYTSRYFRLFRLEAAGSVCVESCLFPYSPLKMSIDPAVPGSEQPSDAKMEFIDVGLKEAGRRDSSPTRDGASNAENNDVEPDSSMNRTKWLACLAMAICYTTYFQQHACVASIVKHIDDKLGENESSSLLATTDRAPQVPQRITIGSLLDTTLPFRLRCLLSGV